MNDTGFRSIAITGGWGYIGRKLLDAAIRLGLEVSVHDPAPVPADVDRRRVRVIDDPEAFYRAPVELFHVALHPDQRRAALEALLVQRRDESLSILVEKPMALPERPGDCRETIRWIERSRSVVLYDFPELFDPITEKILALLGRFRRVEIDRIELVRSKDREDPANPRNFKRMVTIQYQEAVHCLAFALRVLAAARGAFGAALADGLTAEATAEPYRPPNPDLYPRQVDGMVRYRLAVGPTMIDGIADFRRGARWAKRRVIHGRGDGRPLRIECDFLEGGRRLLVDGRSDETITKRNSYIEVIRAFGRWRRERTRDELHEGIWPNARLAHLAYQLSGVLWHAGFHGKPVAVAGLDELLDFESGYAHAVERLPRDGRAD